jgi:putative hemolysin
LGHDACGWSGYDAAVLSASKEYPILKQLCRLTLVAAVAAVLLSAMQPAYAAGVARAPMPAQPTFAQPLTSVGPDATVAATYCRSSGGVVEHRLPVFGTNDPPKQWLVLSGYADFCQYTLKKDGSRIHVLLSTLAATKPTLAALAYYAKIPLASANCTGGGNPASCYCTFLGGSDQFGGTNAAGGAWVLQNTTDVALEACIFPDMSSIDSWGLTYHSANIIRGIDLTKVLKYQHKG